MSKYGLIIIFFVALSVQAGTDNHVEIAGKIRNIDLKSIQVETDSGKLISISKTAFPKDTDFHSGAKIKVSVREDHVVKVDPKKL